MSRNAIQNDLDFEIAEGDGALRWINFRSFMDSEHSNSDAVYEDVVLFVTYNNCALASTLLHSLEKEPQRFNVIVLDNSSNDANYEQLTDVVSKLGIPTRLIRTISNLGSAGGYAAAIEYALAGEWKRILVTEDDAVPGQDNLVSHIFESAADSTEVVISYKNAHVTSFSFHFHLYSRALLERAGVPDPRFFQMADDFEWLFRVNGAARKMSSNVKVLDDADYFHPLLKDNYSNWGHYLYLRNKLIIDTKYGNPILQSVLLYGKATLSAVTKILSGNGGIALGAMIFAIVDIIPRGRRNTYTLNRRRAQFFRDNTSHERYFELEREMRVTPSKDSPDNPFGRSVYLVGHDLRAVLGFRKWTLGDLIEVVTSRRPTTVVSLSSAWRPFCVLAKNVSVISSAEFDNSSLRIKTYRNVIRCPRITFTAALMLFALVSIFVSLTVAVLLVAGRLGKWNALASTNQPLTAKEERVMPR